MKIEILKDGAVTLDGKLFYKTGQSKIFNMHQYVSPAIWDAAHDEYYVEIIIVDMPTLDVVFHNKVVADSIPVVSPHWNI